MLAQVVRFIIGLMLAGFGVLCAYWLVTLWSGGSWHLFWKIPIAPLLFVVLVLAVDNGLGLMTRGGTILPRTITTEDSFAPNKRLFLLFHGYNGRGSSLVRILAPYLKPYGRVVAFEPSLEGHNDDDFVEAAIQAIEADGITEVNIYSESSGGITAGRLLRAKPDLRVNSFVLHAVPSESSRLQRGGQAIWLSNLLHGGPISTWFLRKMQKREIGYLPRPGSFRETVANQADRASLSVTAPMVLGQLRGIANFPKLRPAEFANQVKHARYLKAPGARDGMVDNQRSAADWASALPGMHVREMPWHEGEHVPTPLYGREVAAEILQAAGIN